MACMAVRCKSDHARCAIGIIVLLTMILSTRSPNVTRALATSPITLTAAASGCSVNSGGVPTINLGWVFADSTPGATITRLTFTLSSPAIVEPGRIIEGGTLNEDISVPTSMSTPGASILVNVFMQSVDNNNHVLILYGNWTETNLVVYDSAGNQVAIADNDPALVAAGFPVLITDPTAVAANCIGQSPLPTATVTSTPGGPATATPTPTTSPTNTQTPIPPTATPTATPVSEPAISGISIQTGYEYFSASWTTDIPASSILLYGTTPNLGLVQINTTLTLAHNIVATGLLRNTVYYYEIRSVDAHGRTTTTPMATVFGSGAVPTATPTHTALPQPSNTPLPTATNTPSPAPTSTNTATPVPGTNAPPVISNVAAQPHYGYFGATWTTDKPASSILLYGTTPALGLTQVDSSLTTTHQLYATGLAHGTLYYYEVRSIDSLGQTTTSSQYTVKPI